MFAELERIIDKLVTAANACTQERDRGSDLDFTGETGTNLAEVCRQFVPAILEPSQRGSGVMSNQPGG